MQQESIVAPISKHSGKELVILVTSDAPNGYIYQMRILLVEDSERLVRSLKRGLGKSGHAVDAVLDGKKGLSYARLNPYDVIILDLMLPEMDGLTVLRSLREAKIDIPVLILTGKDSVDDRVLGLRTGADDYLVKPFSLDELLARLEALSRRHVGRTGSVIKVADLTIETESRRVSRGDREITLHAREYSLLLYLADHCGKTVSRIEIEDHLYGEDNFPMSNAVPSAICNLRSRLSEGGEKELIFTRRGMGYLLSEEAK